MADAPTVTPAQIAKRKPTRERGYTAEGYDSWWTDFTEETTPELIWPLSVQVFDRMRRQDAQVGSVLRAVKTPIMRTKWWVDGEGCDPAVAEFVARNLGLPIKDADPDEDYEAPLRGRDRFSWSEHLRLALLCMDFGHSYFEQVYRYDEASDEYRLRKLGFRPQRTISKITVARDGGLVSIEQHGSIIGGNASPTTLPVSRLVAYVLDREGANWLGMSILRTAYANWYLKSLGLRKWFTAVDRFAVGVPIYTDAEKGTTTTMDAGQAIAEDMRGGDSAGGAIPYGAKIEVKGVDGQTVDINTFIRYQDEQIARSALGHVLNLGTQIGGQVGSYNLGSVLQNTLEDGIATIADLIGETASTHIVEDLVDINFGPTVPAPRIVHDEIGVRKNELDAIREAAGLTSDADLANFVRKHATVPGPTPEETP